MVDCDLGWNEQTRKMSTEPGSDDPVPPGLVLDLDEGGVF